MTLLEWKELTGLSASKIAGRAEVSRETVARALKGQYLRRPTALAIAAITDGKVSVETLLLGTDIQKDAA